MRITRLITVLASSIIVAAACTDQPSAPQIPVSIHQSRSSMASVSAARDSGRRIGALHNQAMEAVRHALKKAAHKKGAPLTQEEMYIVAQESLDDFYYSHKIGHVHTADIDRWRSFLASRHGGPATQMAGDVYTTMDVAIQLSTRTYDYLNQIAVLTDQAQVFGSAWLAGELSQLEGAASSELSGDDLEAVYAVASVAQSSAEYWPAYADQWNAMCGTEVTCTDTMGINGWKVLAADVVGALGGFLMSGPVGAAVSGAVASTLSMIGQM